MNEDFDKSIGMRIADLRRLHNLTQAELAERLNVTPKHISHVERGCASLSVKNLIEIGVMFDSSLDYILLGRKNDPALSQLPDVILSILYSGNKKEIERLIRYLKIYEELYQKE